MVLDFSVSDFRSFGTMEKISLVAGTRVSDHQNHLVDVGRVDAKVLRTAVIYGANGAGKSNLCRAMEFLHALATKDISTNGSIVYSQFAFGTLEKKGTDLCLTFLANGEVYSYEVSIAGGVIVHECAEKLLDGTMEVLFERKYNELSEETTVSIGDKFIGTMQEKVKSQASAGVSKARTFLSVIGENIPAAHRGEDVSAIINWFNELVFISPNAVYGGNLVGEYAKDDFHAFAKSILEAAAGIGDVKIDSYDMDETGVRRLNMTGNSGNPIDILRKNYPLQLNSASGSRAMIMRQDDDIYRMSILRSVHHLEGGEVGVLDLSSESDGTKRIVDLLPAFYAVKTKGRVCIIDEMDRSIHALLMRSFLKLFLDGTDKGQLIFTTHESSLLDVDIFRRDEIWFVEKDLKGMTRLYSLNDYQARKRRSVRDYYLQGRYGATPIDFDGLSALRPVGEGESRR